MRDCHRRSSVWVCILAVCTLCAAVLPSAATTAADVSRLKLVAEKPALTDEVLLNPGMGLFIMPGLSGNYDRDWYLPIVAVAYFRVDWSMLEPEEGKYCFDQVLGPAMDYWLRRGKRVALRVMSSDMHSNREYVTPKWVFDAGVPAIAHKGLYVPRQLDPPFWNPIYRAKQAAFLAALGKKYNGMRGLEFVDIGAVGEWGESHLMRWSDDDRERGGYTPTGYTKAYLQFIDLYRRAFPQTPVALNCAMGGMGHNDVIVDYAVAQGIWLRQDGLTPSYPRGMVSRYYRQYGDRVPTLYELCHGYKSMAERGMTVHDTFRRGLEDGISYLNLMGAGEVARLPEADREVCRQTARAIGYRLAPVLVEHAEAIHLAPKLPPRLWTRITWRNLGVASCFDQLAVDLALVSPEGKEVSRLVEIPDVPTTLWRPGLDVVTSFGAALPTGLKPGRYTLRVGLADVFQPSRHLLLPLGGRDASGCYPVAAIPAVPRTQPVAQPQVPPLTLKVPAGQKRWSAPRGMTLSAGGQTPEGRPCLRVEGKTGPGWGYCSTSNLELLPATEYVMSVRMNVLAVGDPKRQPHLKVGLVDANGKWFANKLTARYDTSQLGTWQLLRARFATDPQTAGGHLSLERSDNRPAEATILFGDVRLEAVSAP
jgi:hypothetical protein